MTASGSQPSLKSEPAAATPSSSSSSSSSSWVPEPFVLALGLLVVVVVVAVLVGSATPSTVVESALKGMMAPGQLAFALQMGLILIAGSTLAQAPLVQRCLAGVAAMPSTAVQGVVLVALCSMGAALLNWGLSLVVGAILAREVTRGLRVRGVGVPYCVVGAAGYTGLSIWHGGLSGSAPLKVATASAFGEAIPIGETLFSTPNVAVTVVSVLVMVAVLARMATNGDDGVPVPAPLVHATTSTTSTTSTTVVGRLLFIVVALLLLAAVGQRLWVQGGGAVTLDVVIVVALMVGFVLFGRQGPEAYAAAFQRSSVEAAGVLLQFPLYFAVIGVAVDSGMVAMMANGLSALVLQLPIATSTSAALATYWSAAAVNLVVPSGGGQWAVQAPLIAATAEQVHVAKAPLVMAFGWGDQLTNLLQPFWALPLLSITGLQARHLLPSTAWCFVVVGVGVSVLIGVMM